MKDMRKMLLFLCLSLPAAADVNSTVYLPQVVDGGGWQTTFTIVNLTPLNDGQVILHLWSEGGTALALPFAGVTGSQSQLTINIPRGGMYILRTAGTAADTTVGWADVDVQTSGHIGVSAVIARFANGPVSEAVVPSRQVTTKSQVFAFDHDTSGTGLAMINASRALDVTLNVTVRNEAGEIVGTPSVRTIPAGTHQSFKLTDVYAVPNRGTIEFAPQAGGGWFAVMGLRFSNWGAMTNLEPFTP